ncbi:hypothetical protein EJ02DRAFT_513610 [Clathrospora elynae]|uniref:Uncharacterized protein n=1 Tax=Clathrospora elynae TaxID=706981 RepID=A0A6A5SI18_9PLEO|nr:hypothetical protein EJ02DRAFT_513610 [Clathrospora elynae]
MSIPPLLPIYSYSPSQQLTQCTTYIESHTNHCVFAGQNLACLPTSTMIALATSQSIQALVTKDPGLDALAHFPAHSRDFLSKRILKGTKRLVVATISQGSDMKFLHNVLRDGTSVDARLPLPHTLRVGDENDEIWSLAVTHGFLEAQRLVCAPVFTIGEYGQVALFFSVVAACNGDADLSGRWWGSYNVPGVETRGKKFMMRVGDGSEIARRDKAWGTSSFGFTCERKDYLTSSCDTAVEQ